MRSPAFQLYVREWILSRSVQKMSGDEVKAYMYLLCESWLESPRATLPNDDNDLSMMAKLPLEGWLKIKAKVLDNFKLTENRWINEKLFGISEQQQKFSKWGQNGGNPNFTKGKPNPYYQDNPNQKDNPTHKPIDNPTDKGTHKGKDNLSTSTSTSTSITTSKFRVPSVMEVQEYATSIGFTLNAQYFIDHYETNGWKRGTTSIKDWKACVRTWKVNNTSHQKSNGNAPKVIFKSLDQIEGREP